MIGLQELPSPGPSPGRAPLAQAALNGGGGTARERAAQAVDYYNSTVLRARLNAGLSAPRASYNDRHHHHLSRRVCLAQDSLYRSNSSLELQDHQHANLGPSSPVLRREYGSHGSIDVIANDRQGPVTGTSESFFAMLQDYRPAVLSIGADQRSPGPSEYLRGKLDTPDGASHSSEDPNHALSTTSPKLRLKLHRFWGGNVPGSAQKPQRSLSTPQNTLEENVVNANGTVSSTNSDIEERQRRRAFAHYDCQSLTANLGYAAKLRSLLLARRRNTTTGASAASMLTRSSTPENSDEDPGDNCSNQLLESCPFFRNEVGGEQERCVSLTRTQGNGQVAVHRPPLAYGVSVLEFGVSDTHWRRATCPYQRLPRPIETVDHGALYYRRHFCAQEHQNWFGMDDQLGPVAISIKREKVPTLDMNSSNTNNQQYQYRLVIRTSELLTLRGAILEEAIPNLKTSSNNKTMNVKEVLEYVAPEIQLNCLRQGVQSTQTEEQLLKLDEQGLTSHYKVGIMYCRTGQSTEEEMYNNEDAGPAFLEFLDCISQTVRLKGFDKYKAGLDNKTDSTGLYSVYAQHQDCEVMFHVSTMLPFTPNNRQQLLRKRHIGNDIVTIVFQEPGALPFTPKNIRSQFQHVFIVVRAINPCTENTHYSIAVTRSKEVPVFGPPIKDGSVYPKSKTFADFLLAKVVNAENAAHRSEKFATMATRTRQEYLKDLANNYSTTAVIDTGQKFSIFSSKKKEKPRPNFISDSSQRGAICWQVILDDSGQSTLVECFLGISTDSIVLVEERTRQIVFVAPCSAVLGWSTQTNSLRIYHHQGECVTIHIREGNGDRDELLEIMDRLKAVTTGHIAQELTLRRNPLGQLGFHVQPDGIITQVENMGLAWQAGLRQGARLVEICKVAVSTLSHDQMVDLLKTSILVTVTVIPPLIDGSPRKGCTLQNCRFTGNFDGDYENLTSDDGSKSPRKNAQLQQPVVGHRRRYDRSFSPPRSSNSSGYGTGSSSKSFGHDRFPVNEGTLTSSSSGHSSDDRWYELLENADYDTNLPKNTSTPPPLPARVNNTFQNLNTKRMEHLTHSVSQIQLAQGHHHNHGQIVHNKVQVSHSLPLPHANFSLPLNANSNYADYEHIDQKVSLKQNDTRPLPRTANIEYLVTRTPKFEEKNTENNYTDTSSLNDKNLLPSEDELSNSSGNVSPRLRRSTKQRGGQLTPSSGSSRNHSPRTISETRLRPGVTPRSNRNSANLSSSTLQEDLMKLINPDYMEDNENYVDTRKRPNENYLDNQNQPSANYENRNHNENFIENRNRQVENIIENQNHPYERNQNENILENRNRLVENFVEGRKRPNEKYSESRNRPNEIYSETRNRPNEIYSESRNQIYSSIRTRSNDYDNQHQNENYDSRNRQNEIYTESRNRNENYDTPKRINEISDRRSNDYLDNRTNENTSISNENIYNDNRNYSRSDNRPEESFITRARSNENCYAESRRVENCLIDRNRPDEPLIINNRSRSRENLNSLTLNSPQEVIFTMARPATVISNPSTASSPAPSENKMSKEERLSPRVNKVLTDSERDIDWPNLESATRDILRTSNSLEGISENQNKWEDDRLDIDASITSVSTSASVPELQNHVTELESRVSLETRRRKSLEDEVRRLREENRRLQDESQAAAHQLRTFTEWFFQTIDKQ